MEDMSRSEKIGVLIFLVVICLTGVWLFSAFTGITSHSSTTTLPAANNRSDQATQDQSAQPITIKPSQPTTASTLTNPPQQSITATTTPAVKADSTTQSPSPTFSQSYLYCWNSGALSPHHLGHYVPNDHICSDQELHAAGISGY